MTLGPNVTIDPTVYPNYTFYGDVVELMFQDS